MQYVVCYDIADDARRSRVSNCLLDFGTRVQESVFVANLEDAHAAHGAAAGAAGTSGLGPAAHFRIVRRLQPED
jgi:hypothetical protein